MTRYLLVWSLLASTATLHAQSTWIKAYVGQDLAKQFVYTQDNIVNKYRIESEFEQMFVPTIGLSKHSPNGRYTEINISGWRDRFSQTQLLDSIPPTAEDIDWQYRTSGLRLQMERSHPICITDKKGAYAMMGLFMRGEWRNMYVYATENKPFTQEASNFNVNLGVVPRIQYEVNPKIRIDFSVPIGLIHLGYEEVYNFDPAIPVGLQRNNLFELDMRPSVLLRAGVSFRIAQKEG
jgi:hypothetical protein